MKYDVAIIGGGPAGYTAAERAAQGGLPRKQYAQKSRDGNEADQRIHESG